MPVSMPSSHFPFLSVAAAWIVPDSLVLMGKERKRPENGQTPLHLAASGGWKRQSVSFGFGANVNAQYGRSLFSG